MGSGLHTVKDRGRELELRGELLASSESNGSSVDWCCACATQVLGEACPRCGDETDGYERWTALDLYLTEDGSYVVQITGCSTVPGEVDRMTVRRASDPDGLRRVLEIRGQLRPWAHELLVTAGLLS